MNKYLLSFYIFGIITSYFLYTIKFISDGEIGSIGFEILQLLYCIMATTIAISLCTSYIKSFLLHPLLVITIVHILRLIIKRKEILKISKSKKHKKLDRISLMYIYSILYKGRDKIGSINPYILGYIYYEIAKNSFANEYNENSKTMNIYIDILITLILIIVNILEITDRIKLDRRILPVVFGDCLYHIYEIYIELSRGDECEK